MLAQRPAFAAFPRLKLTVGKKLGRFLMLSRLIVKSTKLDGQVVAPRGQFEVFLQLVQTRLRLFAESLPKLVAFVEQAGIYWVILERLIVGAARLGRLSQNVKEANAQVAPDDGEAGIEFSRLLPQFDGFAMPPAVIEEVSEIIRRACVVWIGRDRCLQNANFLKARRKTIIRRLGSGSFEIIRREFFLIRFAMQPSKCVENQRPRAPALVGQILRAERRRLQDANGLVKKSGSPVVMGQVKQRLQITSGLSALEMPGPPVQWIQPQGFTPKVFGLAWPVQLSQDNRLQ